MQYFLLHDADQTLVDADVHRVATDILTKVSKVMMTDDIMTAHRECVFKMHHHLLDIDVLTSQAIFLYPYQHTVHLKHHNEVIILDSSQWSFKLDVCVCTCRQQQQQQGLCVKSR